MHCADASVTVSSHSSTLGSIKSGSHLVRVRARVRARVRVKVS